MVQVSRCKQRKGTFCGRYGTAFYGLKTPQEKVERAINQGLEGLCPEAVACIEGVHPSTVQRWAEQAHDQAHIQSGKAQEILSVAPISADVTGLFDRSSFRMNVGEASVTASASKEEI